jgi:hypothetical protein
MEKNCELKSVTLEVPFAFLICFDFAKLKKQRKTSKIKITPKN